MFRKVTLILALFAVFSAPILPVPAFAQYGGGNGSPLIIGIVNGAPSGKVLGVSTYAIKDKGVHAVTPNEYTSLLQLLQWRFEILKARLQALLALSAQS